MFEQSSKKKRFDQYKAHNRDMVSVRMYRLKQYNIPTRLKLIFIIHRKKELSVNQQEKVHVLKAQCQCKRARLQPRVYPQTRKELNSATTFQCTSKSPQKVSNNSMHDKNRCVNEKNVARVMSVCARKHVTRNLFSSDRQIARQHNRNFHQISQS